MTRKDYVSAAAAIQSTREAPRFSGAGVAEYGAACDDIARSLADVFAADNPRFDRERFYSAAGVAQ